MCQYVRAVRGLAFRLPVILAGVRGATTWGGVQVLVAFEHGQQFTEPSRELPVDRGRLGLRMSPAATSVISPPSARMASVVTVLA